VRREISEVFQCTSDITARKTKKAPTILTSSITFGAADGVTCLPAGQTGPKNAIALAGKAAISVPATIMDTENTLRPDVGDLEMAPLTGTVWMTARPESTK
jgi:hypothetical protein